MDKRGEGGGRGEGDPRETTECKQVVEEEVRRGKSSPDTQDRDSSLKGAEHEETDRWQRSPTKHIHYKHRGVQTGRRNLVLFLSVA